MSTQFLTACSLDELAGKSVYPVILNGWPVFICQANDRLYAVINRCSHAHVALEGGRVRKDNIICPVHGARFNLETGKCLGGQPYLPLKVFQVRVAAGKVEVAVPEEKPTSDYLPVSGGELYGQGG